MAARRSPVSWLFDLGNTRLKCAPLMADGRAGEVIAIDHRNGALAGAMDRHLPPSLDVAYLASVVDSVLRVEVLQALAERCRRISIARTQSRWGRFAIAYADPARLGVDRFLAMLAAQRDCRSAVLVCGIGTALTVDLVDATGRHRGGRIAPSPTLMREALHERIIQLPASGGSYGEFGIDTLDALAAGCEGAALGLIGRSLVMAERELGMAPAVYLHGGGVPALLPQLPSARWVPQLVLDGLAQWAALDTSR
ncbi:MAG: type III pantothenate kinase [Lysobacter sp.]